MSREEARQQIDAILQSPDDAYSQMNRLRDWMNSAFHEFELYLEDVWPLESGREQETHLEYRLRSRRTLNETPLLASDIYACHCDSGGVWHLDDWRETRLASINAELLLTFMDANGIRWS
ncbi:MAG: hypothetical protein IPK79_03880 [Vampirovibrionales bacterium]|nr:hypothetical protein [Vampirovibrionales bacterium]